MSFEHSSNSAFEIEQLAAIANRIVSYHSYDRESSVVSKWQRREHDQKDEKLMFVVENSTVVSVLHVMFMTPSSSGSFQLQR